MFPNEAFRNVLFDGRRKCQFSGDTYCERTLKTHAWFWPVMILPFYTVSLHPWAWKNKWLPHVPGTTSLFSKQNIDRLIAWQHTLISCKWENLCSPLSFLSFRAGWDLELPGWHVILIEHLLLLPLTLLVWGSGLRLDFSGCSRVMAKGQCQLQPSLAFHPNRKKQLIQWQARRWVFSSQVCLTWNLEALIFCPASVKSS